MKEIAESVVAAKTEIDQTKAVIAEAGKNKKDETSQIVQEMRKIMEGMQATEKDDAAIRQEVLRVAEEITRMSERQEIARIGTEAAMANMSDLMMSSEERTNPAIRDVEHRMLRDVAVLAQAS